MKAIAFVEWSLVPFTLSGIASLAAGSALSGEPLGDGIRNRCELFGYITSISTDAPVPGVSISLDGRTTVSDENGKYMFRGVGFGISRMDLRAPQIIIDRSVNVQLGLESRCDVNVKLAGCCDGTVKRTPCCEGTCFNNIMFWASADHDEQIMRWRSPPRFFLYRKMLAPEEDPGLDQNTPPDVWQEVRHIVEVELPEISEFFHDCRLEEIDGRPNDDPRWDGDEGFDGKILCAARTGGGGHSTWKVERETLWVRRGRVEVGIEAPLNVWRHEIGHLLGMSHAWEYPRLTDGVNDPCWECTRLHCPDEWFFSAHDKKWLYYVYTKGRPAGNSYPDSDPDGWLTQEVRITAGPTITPATCPSNGQVECIADGEDRFGHALSYQWISLHDSGHPAGIFANPSDPDGKTVVWNAPPNRSGHVIYYALIIVATCTGGHKSSAYSLVQVLPGEGGFLRGDVDGNGILEITDPIRLLRYLFLGDGEPHCLDAADTDDSGSLDISDAIRNLWFQFLGGLPPEYPFPGCGIEEEVDGLDCIGQSMCE